jgi:hypothetical protein
MFFIDIDSESIIQVNDRLRINLKKSAGTNDNSPVLKVEVRPFAASSFIQVSDNMMPIDNTKWFLDWEYDSIGTKVVTAKFTFVDTTTVEKDFSISCISEAVDGLYSNDDDLKIHENDIKEYLKQGKTSFKNFHRRAQTLILDELDRKGFRLQDGSKITKAEILDKSEVKEWSTYLVLKLIFESVSNAKDDIFRIKSEAYRICEKNSKDKAYLIFDWNKDNAITPIDKSFVGSMEMVR